MSETIMVEGVEFTIEEKTGLGYKKGECIQAWPTCGEYPIGGMLGETIANAIKPGCSWSYSGKDLSEDERITTVLIWN